MIQSIRVVGMYAFLGRKVTSVSELAPRGYGMTESSACLDTWCYPVRVNFLP